MSTLFGRAWNLKKRAARRAARRREILVAHRRRPADELLASQSRRLPLRTSIYGKFSYAVSIDHVTHCVASTVDRFGRRHRGVRGTFTVPPRRSERSCHRRSFPQRRISQQSRRRHRRQVLRPAVAYGASKRHRGSDSEGDGPPVVRSAARPPWVLSQDAMTVAVGCGTLALSCFLFPERAEPL